MSILARLKRLKKTPEVVENNGGWWGFLVFLGVPAFIAIIGEVDPIFNWFLSLFSVDGSGHITTYYWEIKYLLFFAFFLFIPTSIYLLTRRLSPARLKGKAERGYDVISKEVTRIYSQMYGISPAARHNLTKLHFVFSVDRKFGLRCDATIGLLAKDDLHFWRFDVGAEPEGEGQDFLSDISFTADTAGRSIAILPLRDSSHGKEIMLAFLPYVKTGEKCDVRVTWNWPGCMGQLRERNSEEYGWTCDGFGDACTGDVHIEYVFDKKIGTVSCQNVGLNPSGSTLTMSDKPNEIVWAYDALQAPLGKGLQYRLNFERRP